MNVQDVCSFPLYRYRTHSSIRKVNAAVSNIKSWALGKISKRYSAIVAPVAKAPVPEAEESEQDVDPAKLEERVMHHRLRRARLWALQIQAECYLMSSILQVWNCAHRSGNDWNGCKMLYVLHQNLPIGHIVDRQFSFSHLWRGGKGWGSVWGTGVCCLG